MALRPEIDRERLARVARIYHSNTAAERALRIRSGSLARLCRRHGIETPNERRLRRQGCLVVQANVKGGLGAPTDSS